MGYILKNTAGKMFRKGGGASGDKGTLTPLQAVCSALAGCVGTANIAGVATAMVVGGPGAVFWMWVIALLGMMTKCVEVTLGQYYRIQGKDGVYYGGPMYYIERGMGKKWKPLAIFFAVTIILGGLGTAAFAQPYTMSTALERTFHIPAWVVTVAAAAICGIVLIGGVKGIGKFCEKITPAMCLIYVVGALGVIIVNIRFVPQAFAAIFKYAFAPMPAIGGLAGSTLALALRQGAARGTFSNEAGCGSAPNAAACADVSHPVKQGLVQMLSVFIDTLLLCTCTAFMCLCSGIEPDAALAGAPYVQAALRQAFGPIGPVFITVFMVLFAFTTLLGNLFYMDNLFIYLHKGTPSKGFMTGFRIVASLVVFVGAGMSMGLLWDTSDVVMGLMTLINVPVILILGGTAIKALDDYTAQRAAGKNPVFKASTVGLEGKTDYWND